MRIAGHALARRRRLPRRRSTTRWATTSSCGRLDAHAWAEVWLADTGWLRVDPTDGHRAGPHQLRARNPSWKTILRAPKRRRSRIPAALRRLARSAARARGSVWDNLKYQWDLRVLNYDEETQSTFLALAGLGALSVPAIAVWMVVAVLRAHRAAGALDFSRARREARSAAARLRALLPRAHIGRRAAGALGRATAFRRTRRACAAGARRVDPNGGRAFHGGALWAGPRTKREISARGSCFAAFLKAEPPLMFLPRTFFQRDPLTCAREMIGCELVWNDCAGIIVETEAYAALGDEAAHTFARPSARAFVEREQAGAAYVYFNYGMYWLLNVLVKHGPQDGFVLFRAIEPTRGVEMMRQRRSVNRKGLLTDLRTLCSGPGKLTLALAVDGRDHGRDLCTGSSVGFRAATRPVQVETDVRIGISKAAHFPWRFLLSRAALLSARRRVEERKRPDRCKSDLAFRVRTRSERKAYLE